MSGLAATRLVKRQPAMAAADAEGAKAAAGAGQSLFNAAHFLDKKTDHAAYLHKTLFSVVAIAMSQLATVRPPDPLVWLGIYLLRQSGQCQSVELKDGRVVLCDGSVPPPRVFVSVPGGSGGGAGGQSTGGTDEGSEQHDDAASWHGSTGDDSSRQHNDDDGDGDYDDDDNEGKNQAARKLQSNFRRHRAQKDFRNKRDHRRHQAKQQRASSSECVRV
jgi:hypothetical protein